MVAPRTPFVSITSGACTHGKQVAGSKLSQLQDGRQTQNCFGIIGTSHGCTIGSRVVMVACGLFLHLLLSSRGMDSCAHEPCLQTISSRELELNFHNGKRCTERATANGIAHCNAR